MLPLRGTVLWAYITGREKGTKHREPAESSHLKWKGSRENSSIQNTHSYTGYVMQKKRDHRIHV